MDNEKRTEFIERQLISIKQICKTYEKINKLDKSLEQLYPIAIVEGNDFFVFDLNLSGKQYEYKMNFPSQMNLPNKIPRRRAAGYFKIIVWYFNRTM